MEESKKYIDNLRDLFNSYGFFIDYRFANFSFENPKVPINIEPVLSKPDILRRKLKSLKLTPSKKKPFFFI